MGQSGTPALHSGRAAAPAVEEQTGSSGESSQDGSRKPRKPTKAEVPQFAGKNREHRLWRKHFKQFAFLQDFVEALQLTQFPIKIGGITFTEEVARQQGISGRRSTKAKEAWSCLLCASKVQDVITDIIAAEAPSLTWQELRAKYVPASQGKTECL